jgi:hypothetical protein
MSCLVTPEGCAAAMARRWQSVGNPCSGTGSNGCGPQMVATLAHATAVPVHSET